MARQSEALANCAGKLSRALDCATCLSTHLSDVVHTPTNFRRFGDLFFVAFCG